MEAEMSALASDAGMAIEKAGRMRYEPPGRQNEGMLR